MDSLLHGLPVRGKQTPFRRSVKRSLADRTARIVLFGIRQRAHVVRGFGRLPCCGEDGPVVATKHLEPVGDVLGVSELSRDRELGTEEGGSELGDELLGRIGVVTEAIPEITRESALVSRPVPVFVEAGREVVRGVLELLPVRHENAVVRR